LKSKKSLEKTTIAAFHEAVPEGEGDDFLVAREKTKDELEMEEEEYHAFLEREVGDLKNLVSIDDGSENVVNGGPSKQEDEGADKTDKKKKKKKQDGSESGAVKQKKTQAEKDQEFLMK
jgi:protein KRI1